MENKVEIKNVKFNEVANEWLLFKKNKIKESTYLNYRYLISNKFFSVIGDKTLEELLNYDFNSFVEKLMTQLSSKTVKDTVVILKCILKFAEVKYDVNFKLSLVSTPTIYKKEISIFTEKEKRKIEKKCIKLNDIKELGIVISMYTGLRIGEVCALKWGDIDFDNRIINVTHTLQRVYVSRRNTKVIYTTPKTQKSIRKIPINNNLYLILKFFSKNYPKDAFILSGNKNKWIEPICYRYTYRQVLKKAKVSYKKYHTLRHTFATRCINVGMDVKSLSEILGHANVTITLNTYVHSSFATKNKFINKI